MNKFVITKWKDRLITAQFDEKKAIELGLEDETSVLGNIYIGKVKNIVKNLNSAFVDFGENQTGYYSLTDNPTALFADGHIGKLKSGDEIIVQIAKDAVKTKDPVLTANLNFGGTYAVITAGKRQIGFSSKISDKAWKDALKPQLEALLDGQAGVIVRTNAYGMEQELLREVAFLYEKYKKLIETAKYRTCYSLLSQAEPEYLKRLRSVPDGEPVEIITDEKEVYDTIFEYLTLNQPDGLKNLRFYDDKLLALSKLYSLETLMEQACQKRVWLKSGGYLVIEPTEAMVVIDVNTGKYSGKKDLEATIRLTNLEAAKEICHQLRLRNLSGIIMIDFIDMKAEEDKAYLLEQLRAYARKDSVKTTVIDMTALHLVEMTRKKEKKPLWEQLSQEAR